MTLLAQILAHTPTWVFVVFFVLLALGLQQVFPRQVTLKRSTLLPVAMACFGGYGVISVFAEPIALLAWAVCASGVAWVVNGIALPASVRFDTSSRSFSMPGSAVPLALMMGIFLVKYAAGVTLAQSPQLAQQFGFAVGLSAVYGVFSGIFLGRAIRLWRLASSTFGRQQAIVA